MSDLISRRAAIEIVRKAKDKSEAHRMLVQLPPAQPVNIAKLQPNCNQVASDCISRTTAVDAIDEIESEVEDGYGFQYAKWREFFCNLPPAQPGWIPCNRELPKESGDYLVTIKYGEKQYAVDYLEYNAYGKEWNDGELFGWIVTAWQPAPKPWEGGQDGV